MQLEAREAGGSKLLTDVPDPVLARIQVEDELARGVLADAPEKGGAVRRVVDRPEARGRGDGRRRNVVVQIAEDDFASVPPGCLHHLRARIDAEVAIAG